MQSEQEKISAAATCKRNARLLARNWARGERRRRRRFLILGLVLLALCLAWLGPLFWSNPSIRPNPKTAQNDSGPRYAWVQMLPVKDGANRRLARAIVADGEPCPFVVEDRQRQEMRPRPARVRAAFPVQVCEVDIAADSAAWLGSRPLPVWPENPDTIAVIGDTGCRIVSYRAPQRCDDPDDWPFVRVAKSLSREIKTTPPLPSSSMSATFIIAKSPAPTAT
jgi:hypothetical protein